MRSSKRLQRASPSTSTSIANTPAAKGQRIGHKQNSNNTILENYNTPGHPTAFAGLQKIYKYYKGQFTHNEIKHQLTGSGIYTTHKETHKGLRNPYYLVRRRQQFQIDLIDVRDLKTKNDNVTFLLACIDGFTKRAWVIPLKNKSAVTVLDGFKSIMKEIRVPPETLISDQGTEIKNQLFRDYLARIGTKQWFPQNETHAALVERFNKTIQSLIYKYITSTEATKHSGRYIDVLQKLVDSYNQSYHTLIKMSPDNADLPENHDNVYIAHNARYIKINKKGKSVKIQYKVGDMVLIKNNKSKFTRAYDQLFLNETYSIHSINTHMPVVTYKLSDMDGEVLEGTFYNNELSRTKYKKDGLFLVESILDKRVRTLKGGKKVEESLVKFKGWSNKFNTWSRDVRQI